MRARRFYVLLAFIAVFAAALRIGHLTSIRPAPFYHFDEAWPSSDMHANRMWAEHLEAGDWLDRVAYRPHYDWQENVADGATWERWLGAATYYQPPLYAYLLALGLHATGNLDLFRLLQTLIGAGNVFLIGLLGRRVGGSAAGLLAALFAAGYAPFIFYDAEVLRTTVALTANLLVLIALHAAGAAGAPGAWDGPGAPLVRARIPPPGSLRWLLAGAALGVAYLTDSAIVTFVPLAFLWALFLRHAPPSHEERADSGAVQGGRGKRPDQVAMGRESLGPKAGDGWSGALRRAGWLAAGVIAALIPLAARNAMVGAPLLSSTTRAPLTFVMGNAPDASPVGAAIPQSTVEILRASDYRTGRTILETLRAYHGDVGRLISLQWRKIQGLFNSFEVPDNPSFYYAALLSPVLAWGLRFACVSGLGFVGLLLASRRPRENILMYLYVVGVLALFLVTHVVSRYRQALVIPFLIYAGLALVEASRAARGRRFAAAGLVLGSAVALSWALPRDPPRGYRHYRPAEFQVAARRLEADGDVTRAGAELRKALALALRENARVEDRIELGLELGEMYLRHERYPEALSAFRDVLDEDPRNAAALVATGGIYHDTRQPIEALTTLRRAVEVDPNNAEVQARLGHLYWIVFRDGGRALPHLRRALELAPRSKAAADLSALAAEIAAATRLTPLQGEPVEPR